MRNGPVDPTGPFASSCGSAGYGVRLTMLPTSGQTAHIEM
jgi:hypothetical protein